MNMAFSLKCGGKNMIETFAKDGIYGFRSENFKIEFVEPRIQGFDDYAYLKNEDGIMYYYYGVDGYIKDNKKWKKVFAAGAYDFPGIHFFKGVLEAFHLDTIGLGKYQKDINEDRKDRIWYTYYVDNGVFVEDFYSIAHEVIIDDEKKVSSKYSVTIGKALDYSGSNVNGITFRNLDDGDIEKIYECVCEFIDYSLKVHNERIIEMIRESLNSWVNVDGKLYEMEDAGKTLSTMYIAGSKIDDAVVLVGDINSKDFHSKSYHNFMIEKIEDDGIVISGGFEETQRGEYRHLTETEKIKFSELIYLFEDMPAERLAYNEEEIQKDFMSLLSDFERHEFIGEDVDFLFEKYKSAIMDRSWMCRTEHNLPNRVKDTGMHENVYASIRVIVENIKNKLSAE